MANSTRLGRILFVGAITVFIAQLFFVANYSNDKTSMIEQMTKSYSMHGGLAGRDIPCIDLKTGQAATRARWIEEFPLFPYTAVLFEKILPGETYQRWTPAFFHLLCWIGVCLLLRRFFIRDPKKQWEVYALYGLLPIFVIHETRLIPDPAVLSMGLFGIYLFTTLKGAQRFLGFLFLFLAGLVKPLVLALVAPFALGYALFSRERPLKRWTLGILAGASTVIGLGVWMAYLWVSDIDNPLLRDSVYRSQSALADGVSGAGAGLFTLSYWSRYFTWVVTRGVSWPLFALLLVGLFRFIRNWKGAKAPERIAVIMALFSPIYWALVRGPQYSGPWYSLYIMPGFLAVIALVYQDIHRVWVRGLIALLLVLASVTKVSWTLDALKDYRAPVGTAFENAGTVIDCNPVPIIRAVL